jgi:hypothetical protein
MGLVRKSVTTALIGGGGFALIIGGLFNSGGLPIPPAISLIIAAGVFCLLIAVTIGLTSFKGDSGAASATDTSQNVSIRSMGKTEVAIGIVLVFAAPFIIFPVGCNLAVSCPADPAGTWSTIWPNVLTLDLGLMLVAWGFGRKMPRRLSLMGLGFGGVLSGVVLGLYGSSISYWTSCPASGCPPLTAGVWWSLFWPDVIAESLGVLLVLSGTALVLLAWTKLLPREPTAQAKYPAPSPR